MVEAEMEIEDLQTTKCANSRKSICKTFTNLMVRMIGEGGSRETSSLMSQPIDRPQTESDQINTQIIGKIK